MNCEKLKPCPLCESPASIDSTAVSECYGRDWQSVWVCCTDVLGKHCGMEVSIMTDTSKMSNTWQKAIDAWNSL